MYPPRPGIPLCHPKRQSLYTQISSADCLCGEDGSTFASANRVESHFSILALRAPCLSRLRSSPSAVRGLNTQPIGHLPASKPDVPPLTDRTDHSTQNRLEG